MRRFALTFAVMGLMFFGTSSPGGESPWNKSKIPGRFEAEFARSVALAGGGDQKVLRRFFSGGGTSGLAISPDTLDLTVPLDMIGSLEYGIDSLEPFF